MAARYQLDRMHAPLYERRGSGKWLFGGSEGRKAAYQREGLCLRDDEIEDSRR
jgi:hypothetical protein